MPGGAPACVASRRSGVTPPGAERCHGDQLLLLALKPQPVLSGATGCQACTELLTGFLISSEGWVGGWGTLCAPVSGEVLRA